ncbi:WD40/YVTN/BNR-like repeat-containing protein [Streptomyces sp. LMG1-1-1.1]|uniref:WD40/YVTN/BNR-like repeat-containing protein n=1 Tax=Streptomyces sp. LMG1-1-1.1 TaxID=3135245 RepID=UPI0034662B2B
MRRPVAVAGAVVALVLVVLSGCTGGSGEAPKSIAGKGGSGAPTVAGAFGAPPRMPSGDGLPGWAHSLGFARDGSGFALLVGCVSAEAAPGTGFCRQQVAVRDAGAEEWVVRRSPLPEIPVSDGASANLLALGPGRALIEDGGGDRPERTWFTRDGGRSWQPVDRRTVGVAAEIPAGAVLTTECAAPAGALPDACVRERLVVVSPDDGRRRTLAAAPPLGAHPQPAGQPEPDGSWWVSGTDPLTGRVAVAFSRDAGRSWTVSRLPSPTDRPGWRVVVAVGPDAVYAAEMGELTGGEPVKNPMRALHRSVDGGATWQRMWTTGPKAEPRTLMGLPVPGPGGRVEIGGELSGYASVDGGRTFVRLGGGHYTRRTPLGLLREGSRCQYALTADGVRWSEFRLACGDDAG